MISDDDDTPAYDPPPICEVCGHRNDYCDCPCCNEPEEDEDE